jgi:fructokinase
MACDDGAVIVVVGEALVDLVIDTRGQVVAATLGGAPFNTARTCGRLGEPVAYAGALSNDRFGTMLAAQLVSDHVSLDLVERTELPTTLAAAELDETGAASYRFYVDGTSAPSFTSGRHGSSGGSPDWLFTGGLALVFEPLAATVEHLCAAVPSGCGVMLDVNCRPTAVRDRDRYVARLERLLGQADVVKISDEDAAYLSPGDAPIDVARSILERGPAAVLLTGGPEAVHIVTGEGAAEVAVPSVAVVDTIGAGDAFSGGFLAWWVSSATGVDALASISTVRSAVAAASEVAGVVCTRRGADPPWRQELPAAWAPSR